MSKVSENKLCLGSANFSMKYGIANKASVYTVSELKNLLNCALSSGVSMIDTARTYGKTEQVLGQVGVKNFDLITKIKTINVSCGENLIEVFIENSKRNLSLNKLYGLLLHSPNQLLGHDGEVIVRMLRRAQEKGLVNKVGLSIYGPEDLGQIIDKFKPDILQAPYNVFDQRLSISGWAERLKTMGIEIHLRSVFLQGLLLTPYQKLPKKFKIWEDILSRWDSLQQEFERSAAELALGYCLSQKWADKIIVGVDTVGQLEQLVAIKDLDIELPEAIKSHSIDNRLIDPSTWKRI